MRRGKRPWPGRRRRCGKQPEPKTEPEPEPEPKSEQPAEPIFKLGEEVVARYQGKGKFYPGRIIKVHGDELYDVEYRSGEIDEKVSSDLIEEYY